MRREAEEAGVFAGAIVVQGGRRRPGPGERVGGVCAQRPVRPAAQGFHARAALGEDCGRPRDMFGLAGMRGAGERQLLGRETEAVGRAALDERESLKRLHRGARKRRPLDVAEAEHQPPQGIDHRARAAMGGLDSIATEDLDYCWVRHAALSVS